jgi:hypothetical protein
MHRAVSAVLAVVVAGLVQAPRAGADNPVCTATWCAFYSPSRNISCEIDYQRGNGILDETYCQTHSPPQSVHLSTDGTFKTCTGDSCLGNAGQGTPTLPYGQRAGIGPFNCRSDPDGITCTAPSGRGFALSDAGVTSAG